METPVKPKEYPCPICNRTMEDFNSNGEFADRGKAAECLYCGRKFVGVQYMKQGYWQELYTRKEK